MPEFTKLNAEQLKSTSNAVSGERARIREEYKGYLQGLNPGEGGELRLVGDEKKITVKNRLKRAAEDLELAITFRRSSSDSVRFQMTEA